MKIITVTIKHAIISPRELRGNKSRSDTSLVIKTYTLRGIGPEYN